jgi:hypothetical protein
MRSFMRFLWLCAFALSTVTLGACTVLAVEGGSAVVAVEGPGNRLALMVEAERARFDVFSERGIGRAHVQWLSAAYPTEVIIRLHLRALEGFSLTYGATTIQLALPHGGDGAPLQNLSSDATGAEQPISPDSPYWLATSIVGSGAEGYLEVALPADFFAQRQTQFSMQWVDFYR